MNNIKVDSAVLMPYKVRLLDNLSEGNDKHDTGGSPISLGSLSPRSCQMSDVSVTIFGNEKTNEWIMKVTVTRVCYQGGGRGFFFHYEEKQTKF